MRKKIKISPIYPAVLYLLTCSIFILEAFFVEHMDYIFDFVGYGGTFRHHDLKIMGLPAYWFLMLVGFVISMIISMNRRNKTGFTIGISCFVTAGFLLVCLIGGKLLYILENWQIVQENGLTLDGLSLFGAIFLIPPAAWLVSKTKLADARVLLDLSAILGITLLVCVRTGCFISGCCGAVKFWYGQRPIILPIQLLEVAGDLIIAELCLRREKKSPQAGTMYPTFMICYGVLRFLVEFLRDGQKLWGPFSGSHALALICIIYGIVIMRLFGKKGEKSIQTR